MKNIIKYIIIILIFMMFSISSLNVYPGYKEKQILWYLVGFFIFFIMHFIKKENIFRFIFLIYILLNILLLYLLLFGTVINGSKAWINLGFCSFQPSEFMKITLIILLSSVASTHNKYVLKCILLTLIPSILTFLEPDTGNVIFYIVICISVLLLEKKNIKMLIFPGILGLLFMVFFFMTYFYNQVLFANIFGSSFFYRMDRIVSLFTSTSYQLDMALIGIGAGGVLGSNQLTAIPEAQTDFAFSLLVSLNGFSGALLYLFVNLCFDFLLINELKRKNGVMNYILFTFLCMKVFQCSIHILMNIGLFPITGITLPFISYGGTSLLTYFIILGIISKDDSMDNMDYSRG